MATYKNLTLIGTSHIAKQSLQDVEDHILKQKPDIIAIELDRKRAAAMFSNKKVKLRWYHIRKVGLKGFIFSMIGAWAEKKLGKLVGVAPGSEMKHAITLAQKNNIKIALIDQDIEITLKKLSQRLSWKEKWNFLSDIFKAAFTRKAEIEFDLTKVPSKKVIQQLVKKVKQRYPNIYSVLIDERNHIMAHRLAKIMEKEPDKKILAIIGAGHEEEMIDIIKAFKTSNVSYSFTVQTD